MYTWYIKIILKNKEVIYGKINNNIQDPDKVVERFLSNNTDYKTILGVDGITRIILKWDEICAIFIDENNYPS